MTYLPPNTGSNKFPIDEWVVTRITDINTCEYEDGTEYWEVTFTGEGCSRKERFTFNEKQAWKMHLFLQQSGIKVAAELEHGIDVEPKHLQGWKGEIRITKGKEKSDKPGKYFWNLEARIESDNGTDVKEDEIPF